MGLHRHTAAAEPDGRPCWHMKTLVNGLADGTLRGLLLKYVQAHVARCPRCQAALAALRGLKDRLRALRNPDDSATPPALTPERRSALDTALDAVDDHG